MNTILKFKQGKKLLKFLGGGTPPKKLNSPYGEGTLMNYRASNGDLIYKTLFGTHFGIGKGGAKYLIRNFDPKKESLKQTKSSSTESVFNWVIKLAEPAVQTARHYYNMASPFIPFGIQTASIANKVINGIYPKNKSSLKLKSNKTSSKKEESSSLTKQEVKNKKVVEVPESILMTELSPELLKVDLSTANRTPAISLKEPTPTTVTASPVVSLAIPPVESTTKVTLEPYVNSEKTFTGDLIRSQRPLYSNVNELYNFINTYKDSRESLLIRNVLGNNFTLDLFINLLKELGIRGNLGKRDSGRLANYFTTLKYKNGGLLSRNPIERFKIKKCTF